MPATGARPERKTIFTQKRIQTDPLASRRVTYKTRAKNAKVRGEEQQRDARANKHASTQRAVHAGINGAMFCFCNGRHAVMLPRATIMTVHSLLIFD
jgi:hypothetical protein